GQPPAGASFGLRRKAGGSIRSAMVALDSLAIHPKTSKTRHRILGGNPHPTPVVVSGHFPKPPVVIGASRSASDLGIRERGQLCRCSGARQSGGAPPRPPRTDTPRRRAA